MTSVSTCRVDAGRRRVKRSGSVARSTPTLVWQRSTRASGHWPVVNSARTQIWVGKHNTSKQTKLHCMTIIRAEHETNEQKKKIKNILFLYKNGAARMTVLFKCSFFFDKSIALTFWVEHYQAGFQIYQIMKTGPTYVLEISI